MSQPPTLLPGATIGIFGGGQLGRLTAMAARGMGYRILVLDPDPACPARFIVDGCIEAAWDDSREAANLARGCDVVTLEIEQISLASLNAAASFVPVRPSESVWRSSRTASRRRTGSAATAFPSGIIAPYARSMRCARLSRSRRQMFLQKRHRRLRWPRPGQGRLRRCQPAAAKRSGDSRRVGGPRRRPWRGRAGHRSRPRDLLLVARSPRGEVQVYPAAWNHHEDQILVWSVIPAPLSETMAEEARELAEAIADTFQLEGILAVELFVTKDGRILVNELAPRPTTATTPANAPASPASSSSSSVPSVTCPSARPMSSSPAPSPTCSARSGFSRRRTYEPSSAGEKPAPRSPHFDRALAVPGVRLHLYEKLRPRKGRKMGHLSAVGSTPEEAVELVLTAKSLL